MLTPAGLHGTTVAFESIDGPLEPVFNKLDQQLTEEARARQVAVVSREEPAQYRVRGYLAAHVQRHRTTIAWVWDIYDANEQRAMRLSGEVPASPDRKAWAAADDQAISRMARDGVTRLAGFLENPGAPANDLLPPPAEPPGTRVAAAPLADTPLAYLPTSRPR
jgi:hypothetical protein